MACTSTNSDVHCFLLVKGIKESKKLHSLRSLYEISVISNQHKLYEYEGNIQVVPQELHMVYIMASIIELEIYQTSFCIFALSCKPPNFAGDMKNFLNKLYRLQNRTYIQKDFFLEDIYITRVRVSKQSL